MDGSVALKQAKNYVDEVLKGAGALKGEKGDPGKDGKNAPTITNIDIDESNVLSVTMSDGNILTGGTIQTVAGKDGVDGSNGIDGTDGITPHIDPTTKHWFVDTIDTGVIAEGKDGIDGLQGIKGEKGNPGERGIQGIQGIKGDKGDDGYPFLIYKDYDFLTEFNADDFPEVGLMFMLNIEDENGAFPVYRYTGDGIGYSYVTSLSGGEAIKGDKGDKGDQGEQGVAGVNGKDGTTYQPIIGSVTAGDMASANVEVDEENGTAKFNFVLPKGDKGDSGEDGRSVTSMTTDETNNVIVTFSDGTTQNIGKLQFDISADFLTSYGFGNLRYYQEKFQYYNAALEQWVDAAATPDNILIINMTPNPMRHIVGVYDYELGHYKLKWTEPNDTVIDGQVICFVDKVIIRRKLGEVPQNENDGDLLKVVERHDFGSQSNYWYVDTSFTPNIGDVYYYKAFPLSTLGFYNMDAKNGTIGIKAKNYELYGFRIDQNESDPASMITYIEDNTQFRSAYMDYEKDVNGKFNYGDFNVGDVFFMNVKPCMLKYDGTVDYYLNPNDYTKKINGENSDVSNSSYGGNAMVEFPKIYWKIINNEDNTANIYISNVKLDEDFHCWSHIDNNGNEIDYCYMPIYSGGYTGGALRSLSGFSPDTNHYVTTDVNRALLNNKTEDVIWYIETYADRLLINLLLLLIGKSTNSQEIFGKGNSSSSRFASGTMNQSGLFFGYNSKDKAVKVFGMENLWGNEWRRVAGYTTSNGMQKLKLTYGQFDGSSANGYNINGTGYIEIPNSLITTNGYTKQMLWTPYGYVPKQTAGTATTYYCDYSTYRSSGIGYAMMGGSNASGELNIGMFMIALDTNDGSYSSAYGSAISCKPLAQTGGVS